MVALLTSCGRPDLLKRTLESLCKGQQHPLELTLVEDKVGEIGYRWDELYHAVDSYIETAGRGQHEAIECGIDSFDRNEYGGIKRKNQRSKYYLHLEDDWEFNNHYNWIEASTMIMNGDERIIKVLAREGSPHPCNHDTTLVNKMYRVGEYLRHIKFGILQPWENEGVKWHGFSWNPGVTRLDLLKQFMPFPKWEQDLAEKIYNAGYRVAELSQPVYKHIGDGRSTH